MRIQKFVFALLILFGYIVLLFNVPATQKVAAQQPTGSIATVTGTPIDVLITVVYEEPINVRAGPSSFRYQVVGVLLPFQTAPAIGRSPGGDWIKIYYPGVPGDSGWVYAPYVRLSPGFLPIVEPPPTATFVAPTIDPTLAAQLIPQFTPTRLPTFTPPVPVEWPSYEDTSSRAGGVPMGLVIVILGMIGGFGALISFLRGR